MRTFRPHGPSKRVLKPRATSPPAPSPRRRGGDLAATFPVIGLALSHEAWNPGHPLSVSERGPGGEVARGLVLCSKVGGVPRHPCPGVCHQQSVRVAARRVFHRPRKAVLVSVQLPDRPWLSDDPCDEIRGLAETAGALVVGELTQKRQDIQLGTYIGSGKISELRDLVETRDADVVVFDNDLTPAQGRNLEKALGVKVLDRSEVILDIFATRARTLESRLQVELAQLEYSLTTPQEHVVAPVAAGRRRRHRPARPRRDAVGSRPPPRRHAHPRPEVEARRRHRPQGARGQEPRRVAHREPRRLHQRRQVAADERA